MKKYSLVLLFILIMESITFICPDIANADALTIAQLQAKFPDGKFWNHMPSTGYAPTVNNQDGWTDKPCPSHGNCRTGSQTCNDFYLYAISGIKGGFSQQCMGFAEKCGYDATGYNPRDNANGWTTYSTSAALNNLKPGDIVRYKNNGHSIYITAVNGETVTYGDCNGSGKTAERCIIRWNKQISKSTLKSTFTYVRSFESPASAGNPNPDQPWPPEDGSFVRHPNNVSIYRIAGGAPIGLSNWDIVGGAKPFQSLTTEQFDKLPRYPSHGTYIDAVQSVNPRVNYVYCIAGQSGQYYHITSPNDIKGPVIEVDMAGVNDALNGNPVGTLDYVEGGIESVLVKGWAFDNNHGQDPIGIEVYVGGPKGSQGAEKHTATANTNRQDVADAYQGVKSNHGFDFKFNTSKTGSQDIYVYAINVPGTTGSDVLLGYETVDISSWPPKDGTFVSKPNDNGGVFIIAGGAPIWVESFDRFEAEGLFNNYTQVFTPTVAQYNQLPRYPNPGTYIRTTTQQKGTVYYVINDGKYYHIKSWADVGGPQSCVTVDALGIARNDVGLNGEPMGVLDNVSAVSGTISVSGWAFDNDDGQSSINVDIYIGGPAGSQNAEKYTTTANVKRADVAKAYPGITENHGFNYTVQTTKTGNQDIYVYAVNVPGTTGKDLLLGQKTINIETTMVPTMPQNFAATGGNSQVTLSWSAPADNGGSSITGYQVSSNNGSTWVTAWSSTGHTFTGLTNGTSYTFKVRAVSNVGAGAEATISAAPKAIPAAPQNLTAIHGNSQVTLTWSFSTGNTGYQVSGDNGSSWITASSNTSHTFTGLTNGTTYNFKVRAVNSAGNGAEASITAVPATIPAAPQSFSASRGNGQVALAWSAPASNGGSTITGYQVSSNNGSTWLAASSNTKHTFSGLTNGTSYTFKVRAVNKEGVGAESSTTATPLAVPTAPLNFTAASANTQVTLSWSAPADNGGNSITGYQVSSNNGSTWVTASSSTEHSFTGLTNGTSYTFKVRAVNMAGNGMEATVSAIPITVPTAPRSLTANHSNGQVTLTWSAPSNNGGSVITGYQASNNNGASWVTASSSTSHTFTGLTNGINYIFKVRAVNGAGSGAEASVSANPITVPAAPQKFTALAGNTQVILSWTAPEFNGGIAVTGYQVSSNNGSTWVTPSNNMNHTFTGLTNGTLYTFKVRAVNSAGNGAEALATATPLASATVPSAPQSFTATLFIGGSVVLTWDPPANIGGSAITSYQVSKDNGSTWITAPYKDGHDFTGLTTGIQYTFRVRAVNSFGSGAEASLTAIPSSTPSAPLNLTSTGGDGQVTVTWSAPSSNGGSTITGYQVSSNGGSSWSTALSNVSHTFTGLTNGSNYSFRVRAVNGMGNGAQASISCTPVAVPSEPRNFKANPFPYPGNSMGLTWSVPLSDGGSPIEYYQVSCDNGLTWVSLPRNAAFNDYEFFNLTSGVVYTFKVRAVNGAGSGTAATVSAIPVAPATVPTAPQNVRAITSSMGYVNLLWDSPANSSTSDISGYQVSSNNGVTWEKALWNDLHTFYGLTYGVNYTLKVRAVNRLGNGNEASALVTPITTPSAPQSFFATPGNAMVTLSWSAPASIGGSAVTGYQVSSNNGMTWVPASSNTGHVFSDLTNGVNFTFRVRAVNAAGNGTAASATAIPVTIPEIPLNLNAIPEGNQITITWSAPANNGGSIITGYQVSSNNGSSWIAPSTNTSHVFTSFANGTHTFRVRAVNGAGSGTEASISVTLADSGYVPAQPQNLTVTPGDGVVILTWDHSESDNISISYQVSGDAGVTWKATDDTRYTFTNLTNGTKYVFMVRAVNNGAVGNSALISATPVSAPTQPLNLTAISGEDCVTLTWSAPENEKDSAVTGYQVSINDRLSWIESSGYTSHTFTDLVNGTDYQFNVRAVNNSSAGLEASVWASPKETKAAAFNTPTTILIVAGSMQEVSFTAPSAGIYKFESSGNNTLDPVAYILGTGINIIDDDSSNNFNYMFHKELLKDEVFTFYSGVFNNSVKANGSYTLTVTQDLSLTHGILSITPDIEKNQAMVYLVLPEEENAVLIVEAYDYNGKILDAVTTPAKKGENIVSITTAGDASYLKAFMWDSLDTVIPLCQSRKTEMYQ